MKPPRFWMHDGPIPRLLTPLGFIAAAITRYRVARPRNRAAIPVICCGGATVGGAGKTTLAIDLGRRLQARGVAVHFVTRGYGGQTRGPLHVDSATHDARAVGDEALLLAGVAPCWVARSRAAGVRAAQAAGAAAIILDDGLQHPGLHHELALLVIDGGSGFGNARVLPAGPLREPAAAAARRCRAAVLIGVDRARAVARLPPGLPVLQARLVPDDAAHALAGQRVFAFTGLAVPAKFRATLAEIGVILAGHVDFPDHHPFTRAELHTVFARAAALDAQPVTTAKDAARLHPADRARVRVVEIALAWDDPAAIETLLSEAIG